MKFNRNHAIVCLSVLSAALYFRCVYFAGILEGTRKANRKAVNSAQDCLQNTYHDRVKTLLDICSGSDMTEDDLNDVCDLMNCPL
jgi:hypothetical protein